MKTYTARLATRLSAGVDARLRQLALIRRQRINRLLDELLDAALPPAAELTKQLAGLGPTGLARGCAARCSPSLRLRSPPPLLAGRRSTSWSGP